MIKVGSPEFMYYNECDTNAAHRNSQIREAIDLFKQYHNAGYNIDDYNLQLSVYRQVNLDPNTVTTKEKRRIVKGVLG